MLLTSTVYVSKWALEAGCVRYTLKRAAGSTKRNGSKIHREKAKKKIKHIVINAFQLLILQLSVYRYTHNY